MNEEQMSCQTPLDALISQDSLQIIKAAIPMPLKVNSFPIIYAKVKNYQYNLIFHHASGAFHDVTSSVQPEEILNDMRKYLDPAKIRSINFYLH